MEISNTTNRPLRVNLPGGKRLHLAPRGKGQITAKAIDHPAVQKLIESGDIEVLDSGRSKGADGTGSKSGLGSSQNTGGGGGPRHTGDR